MCSRHMYLYGDGYLQDALALQRVCLEKKQELCADDDSNDVPDVKAIVQELMTNLFISTYNHMVNTSSQTLQLN